MTKHWWTLLKYQKRILNDGIYKKTDIQLIISGTQKETKMKNKLWIVVILLSVLYICSVKIIAEAQDDTSIEMPELVPLTEASENAKQVYMQLMQAIYLTYNKDIGTANKNLSKARSLYDKLVKQVPDSAFVWYKRGQLRRQMQDINGAENDIRKALELNPSHTPATWQLAEILKDRASHSGGKYIRELFTTLKKVIELDPDHLNAHYRLADLAFGLDEYSTAEISYKALTRILPFEDHFHRRLGHIYYNMGRLQEAVDAYQRVVKIKSDDVEVLRILGRLNLNLDQPQEAIDTYQRVVKIKPDDIEALRALGHLYLTNDKFTDAQQSYQQLLGLVPNDIRGNLGLGLVYQELAQQAVRTENGTPSSEVDDLATLIQHAETYLERAIMLAKEVINKSENVAQRRNYQKLVTDAQFALANIYIIFEKLEKAKETFAKLLEDDPDHIDAMYGYASVYQTLGEFDQAETYLRKTLTLYPTHEYALNALGYLYAEQGKHLEEAEALIKRALKQSPDNGAFLDSLGWVLFKQGRFAESVTTLESANQHMPDNVEILMHLGDAYIKSGDAEKARRVWEQAQTIAPDNQEILERLKQ